MRKSLYLHAIVVLSACGNGGNGMPMVDAGGDGGTTGGSGDAGVVHCSRVMYSTASPPSYPTGLTPASLAVNDVNKDGKPDLVVANEDADTVSVLLGNGDGTFKAKVDYPTGKGPVSVAVVDVSKDGIPDVIVADKGAGTVSVLLGVGNGTLNPKVDFPTSKLPVALAVGDVDGDGKPDLVVANAGNDLGGTASVLIGNGNGTFKAKVDFPTGGFTFAIAVGDVNKDGKLDIVATSGTDSTASVLLGTGLTGTGMFQAKVDYVLGLPGTAVPVAVAVVDVSGDGKLDIVAADTEGNRAWVLLNKGDGTFPQAVDYLVGARPQALAVVDITGDGQLDIVTVDLDTQAGVRAMSLRPGKGDGTFGDNVDTSVGSMPAALAVADLDGDLVPDIVVADQDATGTALVLLARCQP